jgi:hypothetical protein
MPTTYETRPFSKVVRDMWGDDRFKKLTPVKPSGQDLWIYFLTGEHCTVIPGLIPKMGFGTIADRLRWSVAAVQKHWKEIEDLKMAEADWKAGVVWLPNAFRHNKPANPNVVIAWRNVPLPQCDLVRRGLSQLRINLFALERENHKTGWVHAFDKVFAKGFPGTILAGFPEGYEERLLEGFAEPFGGTGAGAGAEARSIPPSPPAAAGGTVSLRKPSEEERKWAGRVIDNSRNHCPHADRGEQKCGSRSACLGQLVYERRANELAGMRSALVEAAS